MTHPGSQQDSGPASAGQPRVIVLGTAQDAGYPAAGCTRECCAQARRIPELRRFAACLAIVDPADAGRWLIDCTPDFREQLALLDELAPGREADRCNAGLTGIALTHAHIGHYLGLAQLGREGLNARGLSVFAMPRMSEFLRANEPWCQLVRLGQLELKPLIAGQAVVLNQRISLTPVEVPHRGEFSETVGFLVSGPRRKLFYLPDIDGWECWRDGIFNMVEQADLLYLDGTFLSHDELPGRDLSEIPHPLVEDSLKCFAGLSAAQRSRIRFTHFNHSNPLLNEDGPAARLIAEQGFGIARQGAVAML